MEQRLYPFTPAGLPVSASPTPSGFNFRQQQPPTVRALWLNDDVDDNAIGRDDEGLDHSDDYDGQGGSDDSDDGQDGDAGDDDTDRGNRQLIDEIHDGVSGIRPDLAIDPDDTQIGEDDDAIGADALGRPLPWQQPTAKAATTPFVQVEVPD